MRRTRPAANSPFSSRRSRLTKVIYWGTLPSLEIPAPSGDTKCPSRNSSRCVSPCATNTLPCFSSNSLYTLRIELRQFRLYFFWHDFDFKLYCPAASFILCLFSATVTSFKTTVQLVIRICVRSGYGNYFVFRLGDIAFLNFYQILPFHYFYDIKYGEYTGHNYINCHVAGHFAQQSYCGHYSRTFGYHGICFRWSGDKQLIMQKHVKLIIYPFKIICVMNNCI